MNEDKTNLDTLLALHHYTTFTKKEVATRMKCLVDKEREVCADLNKTKCEHMD